MLILRRSFSKSCPQRMRSSNEPNSNVKLSTQRAGLAGHVLARVQTQKATR
jgi:hypothetical protein